MFARILKLVEQSTIKLSIVTGTLLLFTYFAFRLWYINNNPYLIVFSILLFIAELHTFIHLLGMFYSLWPRKYSDFSKNKIDPSIQVNAFICVCGEPAEIVEPTIKGALAADE